MAKVKGKGKINDDADVGVEKEADAANGTKNENLPVEEAAAASGVGLLSEEQTNAALAALQEASTMVIEAKEAEEAKSKEATCGDNNSNNDNSNKKRKAIDAAAAPQPKKRGPPVRVAWNDRMAMLLEYKETNGDLLIPIRYKVNPSLGKFVHNTREQYKLFHKKTPPGYKKKCSLTAERIAQLQDMGFLWTTERTKRQNEDWEVRLEQLREYKEKHGVSYTRRSVQIRFSFQCPRPLLNTNHSPTGTYSLLSRSLLRTAWYRTATRRIPALPNGSTASVRLTQVWKRKRNPTD